MEFKKLNFQIISQAYDQPKQWCAETPIGDYYINAEVDEETHRVNYKKCVIYIDLVRDGAYLSPIRREPGWIKDQMLFAQDHFEKLIKSCIIPEEY